jgi:hypothetical protein
VLARYASTKVWTRRGFTTLAAGGVAGAASAAVKVSPVSPVCDPVRQKARQSASWRSTANDVRFRLTVRCDFRGRVSANSVTSLQAPLNDAGATLRIARRRTFGDMDWSFDIVAGVLSRQIAGCEG